MKEEGDNGGRPKKPATAGLTRVELEMLAKQKGYNLRWVVNILNARAKKRMK